MKGNSKKGSECKVFCSVFTTWCVYTLHNISFFIYILTFRHIFLKVKVHIRAASHVPDHCSMHALSDPKEGCLHVACDHVHDKSCPSCDQLKVIMMEIESSLGSSELRDEDRDDVMYTLQQAYQSIESWKAHLLRSNSRARQERVF